MGYWPKAPQGPVETGRLYTAQLEYQSVAAAATVTLLNYTGVGVVRNLFFGITSTDWLARERSLINIYIDGEATPSISATMVNFHVCDYAPAAAFSSRYVGYNFSSSNQGRYRYINIPFSTSIRIDIVNASTSAAMTVWASVAYHAGISRDWGRYKRLKTYEQRVNVNAYAAQNLLNTTGKGVLHGLYMLMDGPDANLNFLEGNIEIYLDGESTPSLVWPGTEDYFLWSNYFQGGVFAADYVGCTRLAVSGGIVGAYRFHIEDPIPFDTSIRVVWHNGDPAQATVSGQTYLSSLAWYYLNQ